MSESEDFFSMERRNETLYAEGRRLFRLGKLEEAMDRFKRIYEDTVVFRDVAQIINDYYTDGEEAWLRNYQAKLGDSSDVA